MAEQFTDPTLFWIAEEYLHIPSDLLPEPQVPPKASMGKSVETIINIRTEAAIRNRNGGPLHNAGALAAEAYADYQSAPVKWRRGKRVLGELRSLLNQELKSHPSILRASKHLVVPELQAVRNKIWLNNNEQ